MEAVISPLMFYLVAAFVVMGALGVVFCRNLVFAALFLAATMVALAFMYFMLQAYFIGAMQIAVYAGAVTVLFVMVLMLFDLKTPKNLLASSKAMNVLKVISVAWVLGVFLAGIVSSRLLVDTVLPELQGAKAQMQSIADLAYMLFTQYVFAFEALGALLLFVAVGVVAVSRGGLKSEAGKS